jgi:hypothetical protein
VLGYTYEQLKDKKIVDVQLAIKVQHYERFRQNGSKGEGFKLDDVARDLLGVEYPMDKTKIRTTFKQPTCMLRLIKTKFYTHLLMHTYRIYCMNSYHLSTLNSLSVST